MEKVTAYKTKQGRLFESENQANAYEKIHQFVDWYEDNKILSGDLSGRVSITDLIEWLIENGDKLESILKDINFWEFLNNMEQYVDGE